jgi:hypothetical protein
MNPVTRKAIQAGTRANVWLYRRTNGRVGGRGIGRLPLLLLTVPGRKSGTLHTVPVAYFDHNGDYIAVGTGMGGSKETPQLWPQIAARAPHFAEWQARTGRTLPIVVLTVHSSSD